MSKKYIHGFDEADKVLREMPKAVEHRVLQRSARAGGNVWRKLLRAAAPRSKGEQSAASKQYGRLWKNIKTEVLRKAKRRGQRGVRVSTGDGFWAWFYEFGSSRQPARPFFRPTIESSREAVEAALKKELGEGVEREAKKLAAKNGVKQ